MSLRARLLAGMAVVSFVLVAVAVIIARTTEANLVDRVDEQLASACRSPAGRSPFGGSRCRRQLYGAQIARRRPSAVRCGPT